MAKGAAHPPPYSEDAKPDPPVESEAATPRVETSAPPSNVDDAQLCVLALVQMQLCTSGHVYKEIKRSTDIVLIPETTDYAGLRALLYRRLNVRDKVELTEIDGKPAIAGSRPGVAGGKAAVALLADGKLVSYIVDDENWRAGKRLFQQRQDAKLEFMWWYEDLEKVSTAQTESKDGVTQKPTRRGHCVVQ